MFQINFVLLKLFMIQREEKVSICTVLAVSTWGLAHFFAAIDISDACNMNDSIGHLFIYFSILR
jgi:hypothetical protein